SSDVCSSDLVALVSPVKTEPSVVFTTITECMAGGVPPAGTPTVGFQPEIVPSMVAKRKTAGLPAASRKSVGLALEIVPVGVPALNGPAVGLERGMETLSGTLVPSPW